MVKTFLVFFLLTANVYGQVVLSEILFNEPSGRVRLEWVEVYNRLSTPVDLHHYLLIAESDTARLPQGSYVDAGAYAILARQLLPEDGSDSFEGYWGDSSGVWGDSEIESYAAFNVKIGLNNNQGSVALTDTSGNQLDHYSWNSASDDGRSVERDDLFDDFSGWHDCYDPDGSTPGRANSPIPVGGEGVLSISVSPRLITPDGDDIEDNFTIDIIIPAGTEITVDVFDDSAMKVKNLLFESDAAVSSIEWNGLDHSGQPLPPGLYIIGFFLNGQQNESKFIPVVVAP
jgi:hypothetical protein